MKESSDPITHETVIANRAQSPKPNPSGCKQCDNPLIFALSAPSGAFSVDIETILVCLMQAEKAGYVPEMGSAWWNQVKTRYRSL